MPNNLRIVYDNATSRASLSANQEAGLLVVGNLKLESKADVWRSTGTSATITATFAQAEPIGVVVLPFVNLTDQSTIRVQVYRFANDATPTLDTGVKLAVPYAPLGLFGWGIDPLGETAHGDAASAYAYCWFNPTLASKVVITLSDANNPRGYLEAVRLIMGTSWSPKFNADYGASIEMVDGTKNQRSESFELRSERAGRARRLNLDLKHMDFQDRAQMWKIVQASGQIFPLFISLHPEDADSTLEQAYQIYGKLGGNSKVTHTTYKRYSVPIQIEEI